MVRLMDNFYVALVLKKYESDTWIWFGLALIYSADTVAEDDSLLR